MSATLLWFRRDLRLADNPALSAAVKNGPVIPVFIWAPEEEGPWAPGAASRWWLHHSLQKLDSDLRRKESRLIIKKGPSLKTIREICRQTGATSVVWNRQTEPAVVRRDAGLHSALQKDGVSVESYNGSLLFEPWAIKTGSGKPYQVFTPFWKACRSLVEPGAPLPTPAKIPGPSKWPASDVLNSLSLLPKINWANNFQAIWSPGEKGAAHALKSFGIDVNRYPDSRNTPGEEGTSRLSPHLHFGEISPRQIWKAIPGRVVGAQVFLNEIGWREFAHHLLFHFPDTTKKPLRPKYERFPWRNDPARLKAWQKGETGYPIVDAGMRELWKTGWMHNRVRMIVASFLVKDLLIDWQRGAAWFWDTLVDADLANNTLNWQWTAGCGADAAPFFRIFNPVSQGEKFDPKGSYVRRWIPELKNIPDKYIHKPWECPTKTTYPPPLVDHALARARALEAFQSIRN